MPESLDVSVDQSSDEVEEAVVDNASTVSLAQENTSVPPDDDASVDDTELLDSGLAVAPCPSETT